MEINKLQKLRYQEFVIATLFTLAGFYALAVAWRDFYPLTNQDILISVILLSAMLLADHYPIHLLRGTKVSLLSIPIFLGIILLPTFWAVTLIGLGMLLVEITARKERHLKITDIITQMGRWLMVSFVGAVVVHLPMLSKDLRLVQWILGGIVTMFADFLTFSLFLIPFLQEPFLEALRSTLKEGLLIECIQYLLAIVGAFAALENPWTLPLLFVPGIIAYLAFKRDKELHFSTKRMLEDFADTVDLRDYNTGRHSERVADIARLILQRLQVTGPEGELILLAARLHDIGKIAVPDEILQKAGRLSPEEWKIMKLHPKKGAALLSHYRDFSRGASLILHHHERWDGQGYPEGLSGHQIPFGSRVIAVADAFDAMTSDRPYRRRALTSNQALNILKQDNGSLWDPTIVQTFLAIHSDQMTQEFDSKANTNKLPQLSPFVDRPA